MSKWMEWSQKIQAVAQNGLEYSDNQFDIERYKQLRELAAEIIAAHSNHTHEHVLDYLSAETGYHTPKIDIRGAVFKDEKILMVKEIAENAWTLPGGWADTGFSPSENIEREIFEESGYHTRAQRILALYDRRRHEHAIKLPHHVYKLFFLCKLLGGSPQSSMETSDVGFFSQGDLPLLATGRVTRAQILRMFELKNLRTVDFD